MMKLPFSFLSFPFLSNQSKIATRFAQVVRYDLMVKSVAMYVILILIKVLSNTCPTFCHIINFEILKNAIRIMKRSDWVEYIMPTLDMQSE